MSELKLQLVMSARERITGPMAAVLKGSKAVGRQLGEQRKALAGLQKQQADITAFKAMEKANQQLGDEFKRAQEKVERYRRFMARSEDNAKKLGKGFKKAERELNSLNKKYNTSSEKLGAFNSKLRDSGINTADLAGEQQKLTREIIRHSDSVDKLRGRYRALSAIQDRASKISAAGSKVMTTAAKTAAAGMAAIGGGAYLFKTQFLDTAAEFETFEATLRTVEGSSAKAKASMNWVSDFAAKTPYELAEVTAAFVKLRSYGMDPKNGLLTTLGDTASAMGKDVMDAVEAIADAITGENERLKEFGITASKSGKKITYEYTDRAGNQQTKKVRGDDRKAIEETLKTIWNEKYAGAMRERSRTWVGMMSNMADQLNRFKMKVMENGVFDWLRNKLGGLLDKIDQMAADGTLDIVAKEWGVKLTIFAESAWKAGNAIADLVSGFTKLVGGGDNAIYALGAMSLAPLISSVISLGIALGPVGWTLLAIGALVTGITYAFKNWDKISDWFHDNFGPEEDFKGGGAKRAEQRKRQATSKPPVSMAQAGGDTAGSTVVEKMIIQAAPGMDEVAVAREVEKALDQREQRRRRSYRSTMKDTD